MPRRTAIKVPLSKVDCGEGVVPVDSVVADLVVVVSDEAVALGLAPTVSAFC
jgi:hypothetical protein